MESRESFYHHGRADHHANTHQGGGEFLVARTPCPPFPPMRHVELRLVKRGPVTWILGGHVVPGARGKRCPANWFRSVA